MILDQRFREKLADALRSRGCSQSELARRMNVSRQYVWKYLEGSSNPGLDVIEKFAAALDVDPLNLLDERKISFLSPIQLTA